MKFHFDIHITTQICAKEKNAISFDRLLLFDISKGGHDPKFSSVLLSLLRCKKNEKWSFILYLYTVQIQRVHYLGDNSFNRNSLAQCGQNKTCYTKFDYHRSILFFFHFASRNTSNLLFS